MNFDSPFKQNLIAFDHSHTKAIVNCEINAWMQTHAKNNKTHKPPFPRFVKRIDSLNIQPSDRTSIAMLKQKKIKLLNSTAKKQPLKSLPQTASTSHNTPCPISTSNPKFKIQIHSLSKGKQIIKDQIKISQFTVEQPKSQKRLLPKHFKFHMNINQIFHLKQAQKAPSFVLKNFTSTRPSRRALAEKYQLDEQIVFVRNKRTDNNYQGLSLGSRKLTPRHIF